MATTLVKTTTRPDLTTCYQLLVNDRLPHAAKSRSPTQSSWPVHLNHCFGRIILDSVCDKPWKEVIKSPATRNMSMEQLQRCVELGEAILSGEANLQRLNEKSLEMRGKTGDKKGERPVKSIGSRRTTTSSPSLKRKTADAEFKSQASQRRPPMQSKTIEDYFNPKPVGDHDKVDLPSTASENDQV
jgi:hypothetical protein